MSVINCLIIDDEPLARSLIRTLLQKKGGFNIVAECVNPTEAYESLLQYDIHVLFLDIQMPVISGMDFIRSLRNPPKVIFTTAHANYAAEAFNNNAVDYLVKPFSQERFDQSIQKLEQHLEFKTTGDFAGIERDSMVDYVFFKVDGKLIKFLFEDILYLEALKDFTKLYTNNQKSVLIGEHLKALESQLPSDAFIRIHRSYLVSVKAITGVMGNFVEIGKLQLPVGGTYKDDLMKRLGIG